MIGSVVKVQSAGIKHMDFAYAASKIKSNIRNYTKKASSTGALLV